MPVSAGLPSTSTIYGMSKDGQYLAFTDSWYWESEGPDTQSETCFLHILDVPNNKYIFKSKGEKSKKNKDACDLPFKKAKGVLEKYKIIKNNEPWMVVNHLLTEVFPKINNQETVKFHILSSPPLSLFYNAYTELTLKEVKFLKETGACPNSETSIEIDLRLKLKDKVAPLQVDTKIPLSRCDLLQDPTNPIQPNAHQIYEVHLYQNFEKTDEDYFIIVFLRMFYNLHGEYTMTLPVTGSFTYKPDR